MGKKYSKESIKKIKDYFYEQLAAYNGEKKILFEGFDSDLVKEVLFSKSVYYYFEKNMDIYKKIDFSNISFDNVNVAGIDFRGLSGARLNPQTVYNKSLRYSKLCDAEIIGDFDGVQITGTDFKGSKGAKINPQTVYEKDLRYSKLCDTEIIGSFDGVFIESTDFKGSKKAEIDPQTKYDKGKKLKKIIKKNITNN